MCFGDVLNELRQGGLCVNATQLRWAITSGKVERPPLDGSLRFDFGPQHVRQLRGYFEGKGSTRCRAPEHPMPMG